MDSGAIRRRMALGLAVLTASGLLALVCPGSAQAASYCSGHKVRTVPFATGSVQLYRSGGYVCAVTVPKKQQSQKRPMSVSVQARGNRPVTDAGRFSHHAGLGHRPRGPPLRPYQGLGRLGLRELGLDPVLSRAVPAGGPALPGRITAKSQNSLKSPWCHASCSARFRRTAV